MRIAVIAPACPLERNVPGRIAPLVPVGMSIHFHEQCFLQWGHFAGTDAERCEALIEVANDPEVDAIWFARGG
jgi:muramoyltetrapeptide carboxypeptidase